MTYCSRPGYLLKSLRTSTLGTMNLLLDISTHWSFDSTCIFHTLVHSVRLSRDLIITRSFRESSSHFSQALQSLDRALRAMMKSSEMRIDPLWTLSLNPSSLYTNPTVTLLRVFLCRDQLATRLSILREIHSLVRSLLELLQNKSHWSI